jgi:tetratricopeptide (TPR) repeat protein
VLGQRSGDAAAYRLLAEVHSLKGKPQAAKAELERAIALVPDEPEAYLALAELELRAGSADGALAVLGRLLHRHPDGAGASAQSAVPPPPAGSLGSLGEAARYLMDTRPDDPLGYYLEGLLRQGRGDAEGSTPLFERALALQPDAAGPAIGLAQSLLAGGRPGVADLVDQGDLELAAGRLDGARQAYQQATRLAPKDRRAYGRLAGVLIRQGARAEAVAVLRAGLALQGGSPAVVRQIDEIHRGLAGARATPAAHDGVGDRYPRFERLDNALAVVLGGGPDAGRTGQGAEPGGERRAGEPRRLRGAWGLLRERRADHPAPFGYLDEIANAAAIVLGAVLAGFLVVMRRGGGTQRRTAGG